MFQVRHWTTGGPVRPLVCLSVSQSVGEKYQTKLLYQQTNRWAGAAMKKADEEKQSNDKENQP